MPVSLGVEDREGSGLKEEKAAQILSPSSSPLTFFVLPSSTLKSSFIPHSFIHSNARKEKNTHYHPWLSTILYILRVLTYLCTGGWVPTYLPIKTKK